MKPKNLYKKSVLSLIKLAEGYFNKYIRIRDKDEGCICCGGKYYEEIQAGHFYSGGHYPGLKFNEDNVNSQSKHCNYFKSGNLNEYRIHLEKKIGAERLNNLDIAAAYYKRVGWKWDKHYLINVINTYREKIKEIETI